ncbi:MAG TPA: PAS domain S-box protein [Terriglobales bacterium]|nr:PAS domain S-box protein [Terriglobales bacterium]
MTGLPPRCAWGPAASRRWRLASWLAAAAPTAFGLLSLWAAAARRAPHLPTGTAWAFVVPATALSLTLAGLSLAGAAAQHRAARATALAALLWSGAVFLERAVTASGGWLGRLSPTMVLVMLLAAAILLPPRRRAVAVSLALLSGFTGLITVIEKLLSLPWSPLGPDTRVMSPANGVCLLLLAVGWLATEPQQRPVSFFREPSSAGWLMRRLVPIVLVFPFLLAWIRSEQQGFHPYATWAGSLVFVVLSFVVFLTLVWKAATALDRLDTSRADLQAYAHEISDLYHHAPCGYHSLDAQGRFVKINDTELSWLGYRREEVVERLTFADLLTPASRADFERHFADSLRSGAVHELEVELRRKDGSLLPAVVSSSAIRDLRGNFLRTRSTLFDATQRKQAEEALRRSEARNRAILASAADAIVTLEEQGAIADFNPAAELMFGMRRSVAVEMYGADLLATDSRLRRVPLAVLAGESESSPPRHLEFTARRADGTEFPAELTLTRVAGQSPGLFTAFIRDLTQRKRAEAELRESEERLRLLLDSTGEGIYALDLEGKCILCNPAAVRLLGYDAADELLGQPIHALIHHTRADGGRYPASECKSFLAAREGRGIEVDDEVFWRKDGSSIPVEYRSYPVERSGQPVGLVVTFTDITTRRGLEGQIRQSQKMEAIGRLAAGVAHDFNNLLTVINGYSDMLLETPLDDDSLDKLRSVRTAGDRAATLTHQLLAFSRQQVLQPRVLDLNTVVRNLEPLLGRTLGEDVELSVQLAPGLRAVKADPSQIDQVLMNLVVNARDAMPDGGCIRLETSNVTLDEAFVRPHAGLAPGDYVLLAVRDTGTGMRNETQAHIFEPFFTTKPQGQGTGLGLPTVFGIARQSGGTILVESVWGRGTTMQVYLPAHGAAPAAAPAPRSPHEAAARATGGGETLLVVEDEDDLRRLLLEVLRGRGYHVLEARRPDHALRVSRAHHGEIQLLITDLVMPGMRGQMLAQKLLSERPGLRVLYISGYAEPASVPLPFLKKPFAPEALAQTVRLLLDQDLGSRTLAAPVG